MKSDRNPKQQRTPPPLPSAEAPKKKKKPKSPPVYVEVRYPAWLGIASFAWALAGWLIAAAAPHLAFLPLIGLLNYLLPAATVGLIGANLLFAVRDLWRGAHPLRLLIVTGLQVGLFTTLFFQIYAHLGAEFYDADGPTSAWQWVIFSFAHALRASDIVDFIEAYSLRVQPIKHVGWVVAFFVILYHVVIDVFVLGILWNAVERIKRRLMKDEDVRAIVRWAAIVVVSVWFAAWILVAFVIYPWSPVDVPLWLLENVLRVLDFADIMESLDIHLHSLPRYGINGTLTFVFRIFIGLGIAYLLGRKKKTSDKRVMTPPDEEPVPYWFKRVGMALGILIGLCLFGMATQAILGDPAARLAEAVGGDDDERAQAALSGLRRMGPAAKTTMPTLLAARQRSAPPVRDDITRVLGYFGTAAIQPLAEIAKGKDEASALVAVEGLGRIGAASSSRIAETWATTSFESVRQRADAELRALGSDAVPGIMEITTLENADVHYHWFQELDRNWRLRNTSNKVALALQDLPDLLRRLDGNPNTAALTEICAGLRKCGAAAKVTAPKMLDYLADKDQAAASAAEGVLAVIGPEVTPELLRRADDPKLKTYDAIQQKLDEPYIRLLSLREMWNDKALKDPLALPTLMRIVARQDAAYARSTVLDLLKTSGEAGKQAIPLVITLLGDEDPDRRAEALDTLAKIDPDWRKHPHSGRAIPKVLPRLANLIATERKTPKTGEQDNRKDAKAAADELVAALGNLEPADGESVVQILIGDERLIKEKLRAQQSDFLTAVERLGPKLKAAAPAMVKFIETTDHPARGQIAECMKRIGADFDEAGPALLTVMRNAKSVVPFIKEQGPKAVPHLGQLLDAPEINRKYFAVWAAGELKDLAKPLVPKLLELLAEPNKEHSIGFYDDLKTAHGTTRQHLLDALDKIDKEWAKHPAAGKALAAVLPTLDKEDDKARKRIYDVVGAIGPAARPLIPQFAQLLLSSNRAFNADAAKALDKIDEQWREHEAIKQVIPEVCVRFAKGDYTHDRALILLGPAAAAELEKALEGATDTARDFGIKILTSGNLGKDAVPALVRQLSHRGLFTRDTEALLKKIAATDPGWAAHPKLKEILPQVLEEVVKREEGVFRFKAICKAMGENGVPYVVGNLTSAKVDDRNIALAGLAEIGPSAKSAIPAVQKLLSDKDTNVRQAAIQALAKIGPGNKGLVAAVGPLLLDKDYNVLSTAEGALDKIDPDWRKSKAMKATHAGLLKNLQHKDSVVRIMALVAIEKCGRFEGVVPALERAVKTEQDNNARIRADFLLKHFKK